MITSVHLPLARTQLWGRTSVWERPWNRVELSCQEGKEMNFGKCIRHYAIFFFLLADMRFEPWQLGTKDWLYTSTFYLLTMNSGSKSEKNVDCTSFFVNFIPTYNCMWLLGCCAWEFCQSCCLQKTITMRTNIECLLCSRHDCMHFTCSALFNRHNYSGDRELSLVPFSRQGSWLCVQGHISKQYLWAPKGHHTKPYGTRWELKGREDEKARHTAGSIQNPARILWDLASKQAAP